MEFFLNENRFKTSNSFTVSDLVNYLNLVKFPIAIEVNGLFISKNNWKKLNIKNQDEIEIVTIVGGG